MTSKRHLWALLALSVLSGTATAAVKAGAGSRVVTPDLERFSPVYMAGFGNNRRAASIHDDLYARCLALQFDTKSDPLVICGVDSIGIFWEDAERVRELVDRQLGRHAAVIVAALHDHQAPDTMGLWGPREGVSGIDEEYNSFLIDRTAEAAVDAVHSLRPATLTLARAHPPQLDSFIDDDRPPVVHDAEVLALSAASPEGPIGTLVNWANHPETLGSRNKEITADYSGYLRSELEKRLGGVAVFVNGALGGMQSPLGSKVPDPATGAPAPDNTFRKAEIIGRAVADIAADAVQAAKPVDIDRYEFREKLIRIPTTNQGFHAAAQAGIYKGRKPMTADFATTTPVGMVRLLSGGKAELEIALVPGELYPELSVGGIERYSGADFPDAPEEPAIKKSLMTAPYRMLFGLADDEIGYLIPKAEWDEKAPWLNGAAHRWYGEVNSTGPDAAPGIIQTLQELLKHP
ncbi:MAG TPA: hypothetical protein VLT57_10705 [Bryobacteraceae bacterium]|nr:hypothetical protein [Bryobacteraceae bacterium]